MGSSCGYSQDSTDGSPAEGTELLSIPRSSWWLLFELAMVPSSLPPTGTWPEEQTGQAEGLRASPNPSTLSPCGSHRPCTGSHLPDPNQHLLHSFPPESRLLAFPKAPQQWALCGSCWSLRQMLNFEKSYKWIFGVLVTSMITI